MTTDFYPLETYIAASLEAEAVRYADLTRSARLSHEKDAAKEFQRAANSFAKALAYWSSGVRPEQTPAGNWLIPSQRGPDEPPHLLHMSGDWCCSCAAGESWHWAKALIVGIEMAWDAAGRDVNYDEAIAALDECYG